jgi:hypothetical protein
MRKPGRKGYINLVKLHLFALDRLRATMGATG